MWILVLAFIVAICAVAYANRITLLARMLGQSETRISRHLRKGPSAR